MAFSFPLDNHFIVVAYSHTIPTFSKEHPLSNYHLLYIATVAKRSYQA